MRALQFSEYGSPEVLTWGDAPVPHVGARQIRVAVLAASVNPIDWKMLTGALSDGQPLAGTGYLGYDAAGVVDEVGEGVTGLSAGDQVFGLGPTDALKREAEIGIEVVRSGETAAGARRFSTGAGRHGDFG